MSYNLSLAAMFIDSMCKWIRMCVCTIMHGVLLFSYADQFLKLLGRKMKFDKTKSKINVNEHTQHTFLHSTTHARLKQSW